MNPTRTPDRPPEKPILTFRPGLLISETCLQVGSRHYALAGLRDVYTRRTGHDPLTLRCAGLLAGGTVLTAVTAPVMRPAGILAAVAVLAVLAALTVASARHRPRQTELWADYRGQPTQLLISPDSWLVEGVHRALYRALLDVAAGHRPRMPAVPTSVPHPSRMHPADLTSTPVR